MAFNDLEKFKRYGQACADAGLEKYIRDSIPYDKQRGIYRIHPLERKMIEALGISDEAYVKGKYNLNDSD